MRVYRKLAFTAIDRTHILGYRLEAASGRSTVGSVPGLGPGGPRFESARPDQIKMSCLQLIFICPGSRGLEQGRGMGLLGEVPCTYRKHNGKPGFPVAEAALQGEALKPQGFKSERSTCPQGGRSERVRCPRPDQVKYVIP